VDPVLYPLLLRISGSSGNRTRDLWVCSQHTYQSVLRIQFACVAILFVCVVSGRAGRLRTRSLAIIQLLLSFPDVSAVPHSEAICLLQLRWATVLHSGDRPSAAPRIGPMTAESTAADFGMQ
jgi:hypothetical protein